MNSGVIFAKVKKEFLLYRYEYTIFVLFLLLNSIHFLSFFSGQYASAVAGSTIPDFFDFLVQEKYETFRYFAYLIHTKWSFFLTMPIFILFYIYSKRALVHALVITIILTILRAIFLPLTNLGIPYGQLPTNSIYTFGGDLFFSGHVAKSFAFYLVSRHTPFGILILMGHFVVLFGVIMGRYHYLIDIISAYFIAYTVYVLTKPLVDKYF